ncbi:hypothetical protein D3C84_1275920 [compost metagenome]
MLAGCCASDSASPRLTARANSCRAFMNLRPASIPPLSSKAIMPPGKRICRCASSYWANDGNPG